MTTHDRASREAVLHRAVLSGDEQAWRTLYEETFDPLYRYVHWRCAGMGTITEETVQETWLTAVRRIRKFDPQQGHFLAWVRGIAANVLRNQFRRHTNKPTGNGELDVDLAIRSPPEAALENQEQAEQIAAALARLPGDYEYVLRAKYVDAHSVAEIAACLQRAPKAVESLLTRARTAFRRECLQQEDLAE
jgi:RNA polymerase sigma-70 factor, ECF subfamily